MVFVFSHVTYCAVVRRKLLHGSMLFHVQFVNVVLIIFKHSVQS